LDRRDERGRSALSPGLRPFRVFNGGPATTGSAPILHRLEAGSPVDAPVQTIGRYALHTEIASGGMAAVHIGRLLGPVGFARTVAIKRLHPPLAKDPEFVAMFLDEARLAARIRHPNVVSTLDVVATEGELFVVMEYVPGESLARLLRAVRTNKDLVPVPVAATIMVGVLHGLHAAHEARDERGDALRIVHRDVSPHNILVGTDGDAHVIDFGIAKARGRMQVTRQGQIKGKLSYMPSEQLLGQPLDHRADIFAASIVLWEALTGQRLYEGVDDGEVYAKVLSGSVDPPSLYAKGLSPAIDAIVMRGLARERTDRYSTAREMALAIEAAVSLAPPSQVGRWVEGLVGEALAERTEQIADIERLDDGGESGDTSSAILSLGSRSLSPGNAEGDLGGVRASSRPSPGADHTAPTQPGSAYALGGTDPRATVVDRPVALASQYISPSSTPGAPRRGSLRLFFTAATIVALSIAIFGARDLRRRVSSIADVPPAKAAPVDTHAAAPSPAAPDTLASSGWIPLTPLPVPAQETNAEPRPPPVTPVATGPRKRIGPAVPLARAAPAHTSSAQQGAESSEAAPAPSPARAPAANSAGCDPPFWIDADGTKRYNRHCGDL
jgi:serine/threonine protein kinase